MIDRYIERSKVKSFTKCRVIKENYTPSHSTRVACLSWKSLFRILFFTRNQLTNVSAIYISLLISLIEK